MRRPNIDWPAILLAVPLLLLSSCANLVSRKPTPTPSLLVRAGVSPARHNAELLPGWVKRPPSEESRAFVVGEAASSDKDDAMAKAWASALVRLGMTEFPELSRVGSTTTERLEGGASTRELALHLEQVRWAGLTEAKEMGSPLIYWDEREGNYRVYRLLRWDRARIEEARAHLDGSGRNGLPMPPELQIREEQRITEAVSDIQRINARNRWKDRLYRKVFGELKCGVTIADLIKVLGAPDRFNPYNRVVMEKEYYWGDYRVERRGADTRISSVTWEQPGREKTKTCLN